VIALQGPLRIQLPVAESRLTAIGYHGGGDGSLARRATGYGEILAREVHQPAVDGGTTRDHSVRRHFFFCHAEVRRPMLGE